MKMNIKKIMFISVFNIVLMLNAFGDDIKEMLFTSPIIYGPVIEMALSKNKEPLSNQRPIKIAPFEIRMIIAQFSPNEEEKKQFDSFIQISFKEISNTKFLIFKKNNLVQQLHVVRTEAGSVSVTKYERNLNSLLSKIPKTNEAYIAQTQEIITSLLKQEDFLTDLPLGENVLTFKLELLTDVAIGDVYFSNFPYSHIFCFEQYYINSALRSDKTKRLMFAVTFWNKYISLANLFDKSLPNGFECYFYPNQGLKYLTDLKDGKQMNVTTWDVNGNNEKKIPFDEWFKIINARNK
jgi:hypothetical protein